MAMLNMAGLSMGGFSAILWVGMYIWLLLSILDLHLAAIIIHLLIMLAGVW